MSAATVVINIIKWSLCILYSIAVVVALFVKWFIYSLSFWRVKSRPTPPECLTDPGFNISHKYLRVNGVKIHCVCAGDDKKELMLMVHGFPEFWYSWRHQMKRFLDNYWVVAIDMRGYGDSDKPEDIADYKLPILTKDLMELISALGRKKIDVLVGHDWGGVVCWDLVSNHPDLVRKFISVNIPHSQAFLKVIRSSLKQFMMSWYIFFFQMPYLPEILLRTGDLKVLEVMLQGEKKEWSRVTDNDVEAFKYTYSKCGSFTGPINFYRANAGTIEPVTHIRKIPIPVLMVWGNKDVALSEEMAHLSRDYVENYTLKIVEGAPHFVTNSHPEQVNKHMSEWLNIKN